MDRLTVAKARAAGSPERRGLSILVVEPSPGAAAATARFLALGRPQYTVECATNPAEALARLEQSWYDLVLIDRGMASGTVLPADATAVVLMDDEVTDDGRAEARGAGALDLLARSADGMEELFRTTDRLSEMRRLDETQPLLLRRLYGEGTVGPCSTGGSRRR